MSAAVTSESLAEADSGADGDSRRARFRRWRQQRPFWGCATALFAGFEIYIIAATPLKIMAMQGLPGILTLGVALTALVLGGVTLYQPHLRSLTGLLTVVLGPLSIMATNLGGFIVGTVLLVVGGGLMLAWVPGEGVAVGGEPADLASAEPEPAPAAPAPRPVPHPAPRPPVRPRSGLSGILDTMFGARVSGGAQKKRKPTGKKKPPPGRKPPPGVKRPPGAKRPPQKRAAQRTTAGDLPPAQETRNP